MNVMVEILTAAKARIDTPKTWTKRAGARDTAGNIVDSYDPTAVCYCSVGAIYAVGDYSYGQRVRALSLLGRATGPLIGDGVVVWNDAPTRTHAEVMAAFTKAIKLAEEG